MKKGMLLLGFGAVLGALLAIVVFWNLQEKRNDEKLHGSETIVFVRDILKLGVVEQRLSQIFEVQRENLSVSNISIPWTGQRSVVAVKGSGLVGYDLDQISVTVRNEEAEILVSLPLPTVLSIELDFDVITEEDTFFNRLSPDDRNRIRRDVKEKVLQNFMTKELEKRVRARTEALLKSLSRFLGVSVRNVTNPAA